MLINGMGSNVSRFSEPGGCKAELTWVVYIS